MAEQTRTSTSTSVRIVEGVGQEGDLRERGVRMVMLSCHIDAASTNCARAVRL